MRLTSSMRRIADPAAVALAAAFIVPPVVTAVTTPTSMKLIATKTLAAPPDGSIVIRPSAPASGKKKLVVFLGGSKSGPGSYKNITGRAAALNFDAIDLAYDTSTFASSCDSPASSADSCYGTFRNESFFGFQKSGVIKYPQTAGYPVVPNSDNPNIAITPAASIAGRLTALLRWLAANDTAGNWQSYLVAQKTTTPWDVPATPGAVSYLPDWTKVILVGHSQGGGNAVYGAKYLPVQRAIALSSPDDAASKTTTPPMPASWIKTGWPTINGTAVVSRIWGLRNGPTATSSGEGIYGSDVQTIWSNLGGVGMGASVPGGTTPYVFGSSTFTAPASTSHQLVLNYNGVFGTDLSRHNSTAADGSTPDSVCKSALASPCPSNPTPGAWDYLLTAAFTDM